MTIQTIPLNKLTVADGNNPRRSMDAAALDGLAASIKADGLLQNLVVRKDGRKFRIVSGERRYRALSLLAERGDIGKDYPVAVEVRGGLTEADALRLATVENIQREQLAPMDEAEAFAALLGEGASLEDVAAKAGVSVLTVKRRVALASLCEEAKALVREGEFSLSIAEALTLATHDQQRALIERLEQGYHYDADDVRGMLTGEKPAVALAIFPMEQYEGTVTADLFAADDNTFFDDAEQFFRLQSQAVEALAAHHREAGAAFVELLTEGYAPWWQYREADTEQDEAGGVVIHFKPSGRVEVREGLVRRDVRPSVAEATAAAPATPKPQPEYTGPVVRMVAAHKSMAVMEALLADARKAKEVAAIQMMRGIRYHGRIAVDAHPALAYFCTSDNPPVSYSAVERTAQEFVAALGLEGGKRHPYARPSRGAWDVLLGDDKSAEQLYAAVKSLSDSKLEQLHLLLTALAFGQESMEALDTTDSLFNQVAVDLGVDMRDRWVPDEDFLYRRRKEHLEAIARESGAVSRLGKLKDYTKGKLADALAKHFQRCAENDATLPADLREQGRNWLPGAMLFPAVTADAPAEQEAEDIEADEHDDNADPSDIEADEDDLAQAAA
ncbi:ParB/RepB/Spo0J family partition protein [Polymorphum gilvum]|uniref:Helix-turn-helix, Fis-type n=1 Tax=Polymorphum gilvum (strain LMG 25793 / CGMCC 1.9160 / SL003B-26A1) TaxID=991905 RepID=F2IUQ5_POLGS|nr:ParB/RepB/Spo0J family partition protein [Polymorphum gilvum]ADZ69109.1 Helix-turn-helix, Fis-type [Polymorphum gilvum SL003B-26A1]